MQLSKKISLAVAFATVGLIQILPFAATAQPLAVAHVSKIGGRLGIVNSYVMRFGYRASLFAPFTPALFDQFILTTNDVGRTFEINSQNDPEFGLFAQKLTNGQSDLMCFADAGSGNFNTESNFFNPLPAGSNGFDLQGFSIGKITLTVDTLILDSPGSNPNGNGNWTDINFQGTIGVYAVPEPQAFSIIGITSFFIFRRLSKK